MEFFWSWSKAIYVLLYSHGLLIPTPHCSGTPLIRSLMGKKICKQLLDEVFVISGIIKVKVSVISRSRRLRLITLTETLIIPDITKTESNNCFIILYLQVISQFLAGSMKRIEKPFLLCCPRT